MDPAQYPPDWPEIAGRVKARDGHRCVGVLDDLTGRLVAVAPGGLDVIRISPTRSSTSACRAPDGRTIARRVGTSWEWIAAQGDGYPEGYLPPVTVVLAAAHIDHDTTSSDERRIVSLCQRCHRLLDAPGAARRRRERAGQMGGLGGEV